MVMMKSGLLVRGNPNAYASEKEPAVPRAQQRGKATEAVVLKGACC